MAKKPKRRRKPVNWAKMKAATDTAYVGSPHSQMWFSLGDVPEDVSAMVANMGAAQEKIRKRLADLGRQRANYVAYQADRVAEGDNHAVWDSAIDVNLLDYEVKGLQFALDALEGK